MTVVYGQDFSEVSTKMASGAAALAARLRPRRESRPGLDRSSSHSPPS